MMEKALVEYLANALWQVPVIVAGASMLLWAVGADLRTRHRVWLAALALALLLPLRGMSWGEGTRQAVLPPPLPAMIVVSQAEAAPAVIDAVEDEPEALETAPPVAERSSLPSLPSLEIGSSTGKWLARLYLATIAFGLFRVARSWIAARTLLRRSDPLHLPAREMAIFAQVAHRQGQDLPRLRQSAETASPLVIGAFRPVLVLPEGFLQLKDDEVVAALSHELAHVERRDYLVNLLCQFAVLPLLWHPATHLVLRRIRDTREMICDGVAASHMRSPLRYAACLVSFALRALDGPRPLAQAVSMFDNQVLEDRIIKLTEKPVPAAPRARMLRFGAGSAGLAMALALALMFRVTPTFAEPPAVSEPSSPVQPVEPPTPLAPPAALPPPAPPSPPGIDRIEMQKSIEAEAKERANQQRRIARKQAEATAEAEREKAQAAAEAQRDRDEAQREAQQAAREAQREAQQAAREAEREARQAAREHADEIRRQVQEAMRGADMEKMRRDVEKATAFTHSPEFTQQMAQLHANMQELNANMAQLHQHMEELKQQMRHLDRTEPM